MTVVLLAALAVPLGWFGGWTVKNLVTQLIPTTLRGYPIAALLSSGAGLGLLTTLLCQAVYDPAQSLPRSRCCRGGACSWPRSPR
jgi:hypothetical protein